jgi:phosphate transport system substrate-binding protein
MERKIFLAAMLTITCIWGGVLRAETLVIPGTGACEVVLKVLAADFNSQNPGQEVIVPPSIGSSEGIRLVGTDQALLGRVARPLEEKERGYGLRYLPFARDAVIFAVGANAEVKSLTPAQLTHIFNGKITNWQEAGGNRANIRVVIREPGDSSLRVIVEHIESFRKITFAPSRKIVYHDYEMIEMLGKYRNAIGWVTGSSVYGVKTYINPVAMDNILPTTANVQAGRYKLVVDYALVYKEKRLNKLAQKFVDFILSNQGQAILLKYGLIPSTKE